MRKRLLAWISVASVAATVSVLGDHESVRGRFLILMGVTDEVITNLTPEQRRLTEEVVDYMNPVSQRAAGVTFDHSAAMPNERIAVEPGRSVSPASSTTPPAGSP